MTTKLSAGSWSAALLLGLAALGCTPGGVGDPCTPEDEYQQSFNGFQVTETNVESRSFQCETRLCLVNHFQGRVSCRLGQPAPPLDAMGKPVGGADYHPACSIPGTAVSTDPNSPDNINVEVKPQLVERQTDKAVYCSCRCDGPEKGARYCECPEGFQCEKLVKDLKITLGASNLAGSYCIRSGSRYDVSASTVETCDRASAVADPKNQNAASCGCGGNNPPAECGKL
jgi:hypothetical protein